MNAIFFLLLTTIAIISDGDVIRTVFCKEQCTDYLEIPENSMLLCAAEHLQLKECGTVVSCDWAEADRDKVRPRANSSDILCCYRTVIKQKGECVEQLVGESEPIQLPVSAQMSFDHCGFHFISWILCIALFAIVVLLAGYIVKLRISGPKHQKVSQSDEMSRPQAIVTQPLLDMQQAGNAVNGRVLSSDELYSALVLSPTITRSE